MTAGDALLLAGLAVLLGALVFDDLGERIEARDRRRLEQLRQRARGGGR
jgi:hypothetical protein